MSFGAVQRTQHDSYALSLPHASDFKGKLQSDADLSLVTYRFFEQPA